MDMNNYMERSTVLVEALPSFKSGTARPSSSSTAATP